MFSRLLKAACLMAALLPTFASTAMSAEDLTLDKNATAMLDLYSRMQNDAALPAELRAQLDRSIMAYEAADLLRNSADPLTAARGEEQMRQTLAEYSTRFANTGRENARVFTTGIGRRLTAIHNAAREENCATPVSSGYDPFGYDVYDAPLPAARGPIQYIDEADLPYPEPIYLNSADAYPSIRIPGVNMSSLLASACPGEDTERFWVGGYGTWSNQRNRDGIRGYKYDNTGLIAGYDIQRGDWTLGVSGSFGTGKLKNSEGYTKTDVDTLHIGLYASYDPVSGFYADANLGYGHGWNKTKTVMLADLDTGGTKNGKFNDHSLTAGFNVGQVITWDELLRITPTFGVQWTRVNQDSWTETVTGGAAGGTTVPYHFGKTENDYVEMPLMVRVSKAMQLGCGSIVTPELRVGYVFEAGDKAPSVKVGYAGSADSATLYGADYGSGRTVVGGGVKANINSTMDAFVDYNLEYRKGYTNNTLTSGIGVTF